MDKTNNEADNKEDSDDKDHMDNDYKVINSWVPV